MNPNPYLDYLRHVKENNGGSFNLDPIILKFSNSGNNTSNNSWSTFNIPKRFLDIQVKIVNDEGRKIRLTIKNNIEDGEFQNVE